MVSCSWRTIAMAPAPRTARSTHGSARSLQEKHHGEQEITGGDAQLDVAPVGRRGKEAAFVVTSDDLGVVDHRGCDDEGGGQPRRRLHGEAKSQGRQRNRDRIPAVVEILAEATRARRPPCLHPVEAVAERHSGHRQRRDAQGCTLRRLIRLRRERCQPGCQPASCEGRRRDRVRTQPARHQGQKPMRERLGERQRTLAGRVRVSGPRPLHRF